MYIRTRPLILIAILPWCAVAWACGASLAGRIVDPSGAAIRAVTVALRNNAIGTGQTAVTSSDVSYSFADLPAGRYDISIHQLNFQRFKQALELAGSAPDFR
jgi:hypothetical protein